MSSSHKTTSFQTPLNHTLAQPNLDSINASSTKKNERLNKTPATPQKTGKQGRKANIREMLEKNNYLFSKEQEAVYQGTNSKVSLATKDNKKYAVKIIEKRYVDPFFIIFFFCCVFLFFFFLIILPNFA
jgi:hypothetical protein